MVNRLIKIDKTKTRDRIILCMKEQSIASQVELAVKTQVPQSVLSNLMNAKRDRYYLRNIEPIAQYLNVNTEWLAGRPYARKERVVTPEGTSLPQNNLFRQIKDAETPEQPKGKRYTLEQLLLAQAKLLKSIDENLRALLEKEAE